jgi:hypothetical protein
MIQIIGHAAATVRLNAHLAMARANGVEPNLAPCSAKVSCTGGGTRLRCSFGHATHQPPSSVRDRCRADYESFPCAGTEARKSGTENLMPTGPTCGGVAASSDFAILATTAERREAF